MEEMSVRRRDVSDRGVEQAIVSLKKGAHLLKCGRRGKPKFCPFRLSTDEKVLIWYSGEEEKHLKLSSVTKIVLGQQTVNFLRLPLLEKEKQSFSLVYQNGKKSLDLICRDKEHAESWFLGLTALVSISHQFRPVSNLRNVRGSQSCANSPVGHSWRQHNLGYLEDSTRFSQVQSLCSSPPRSQLQRQSSSGLSFSFNDLNSSTPRSLLTAQTIAETRLPHLPQVVYQSLKERMKENHANRGRSKVGIAKTKPSSRFSPLKGDSDALRDVLMWGEGIEGGIIGGGPERFSSCGMVFDALLPKQLESTKMLDVRNISCGRKHVAIVTKQGAVFSWGEENGGRLGHKINMDVPYPKIIESIAGLHVEVITCGANHTCALTSSGEVYAWGSGVHGDGTLNDRGHRSQWLPHRYSGPLEGIRISRVACGEWHTAVVTTSGQLFTFGDGTFGVLGHGNVQNLSQPKEVESLKGLRVKSVACGPWHTAAIVEIMVGRYQGHTPGGKLFTWGDNDKGRLGHRDKEKRLLPTCVASLVDCDFVQVSCGSTLTVALSVTGMVFTMGSSENGQLGSPQAEDKSIEVVEGGIKGQHVKQISSGSFHVVVLTTKGEVYSWGKGANGRLGLGDTDDRNSPALVESLKDRQVETVACGSSFSAAICLHKSILSSDQSVCSGCKMFFGFTRKKHNCYNCGSAFCHSCTSKRVMNASLAPNKTKQFRVCDPCFSKLKRSADIRSTPDIQTPRPTLAAQKGCSGRKTDGEEMIFAQPHSLSSNKCMQEGTRSLERQTSIKQGRVGPDHEDILHLPSRTQRWGEVSCPPQFIAFQREYPEVPPPLLKNELSNLCNFCDRQSSKPTKPSARRLKPGLTDMDKMLAEELHRLREEVQNLTKQCRLKSEKLILYKQRIDETWSVARAEAAKCKAAKDIIKVLTAQMNAMAGKFSAGRELNNLKSLLCEKLDIRSPQIRPVQTEHVEPVDGDIFVGNNDLSCVDQLLECRKANNGLHAQPNPSCGASEVNQRPAIKKTLKGECVGQDEPGVYITFDNLPCGKKSITRVRFSRKHFSEAEAQKWWEQNQIRIYLKYNVERMSNSGANKTGT